jgi:hypothetical protein
MKTPQYKFAKIVIGGSLHALLYSYEHGLPLIINKLDSPYRFEPEKKELWNKLYFLLSLSGLNLLGDKTKIIRINDEQLSITTNNSRIIKIEFSQLIVFDDEFVFGLPTPVKEKQKFMVLDWMITKSCTQHDKEYITTKDNFVKEIHFYPTDRIDGNHLNKKDLVSVSYLTKKQLQDFNYSDAYSRFKTEKLLKENKITGRKNGYQNGKQINYNLKLEVKKREIKKLGMHLYKDTENIKFKYENPHQMSGSALKYAQKLGKLLGIHD